MSLVREISEELTRSVGLRQQAAWGPAIEAALEVCLGQARGLGCLDNERRTLVLAEVARHITVPETHFFRNHAQLALAVEHVLRGLGETGPRRIWCAGCASGEEPYSLAMLASERLGGFITPAFEIVASDLNPEAIEKARRGVYTSWSFRGAPSFCFNYFSPDGGSALRLSRSDVKDRVQFLVESCQAGARRQQDASLDVVLFRNVAIYLEQPAIDALYREFFRVLKPGGLLGLGSSDPMPSGLYFRLLGHYDHAPLFERTSAVESEVARLTSDVRPAKALRESRLGRYLESVRQGLVSLAPDPHALGAVRHLVEGAPADGTARRLMGQLHLEAGNPAAAVGALRQAVFLEPKDVLSRYFYALALHESGDLRLARRQLDTLLGELRQLPARAVLEDTTTTVLELLTSAEFLEREWT